MLAGYALKGVSGLFEAGINKMFFDLNVPRRSQDVSSVAWTRRPLSLAARLCRETMLSRSVALSPPLCIVYGATAFRRADFTCVCMMYMW